MKKREESLIHTINFSPMIKVREDNGSVILSYNLIMSWKNKIFLGFGLNLLHFREIPINKRRRRATNTLHAQLLLRWVWTQKHSLEEIKNEGNKSNQRKRRQDSEQKMRELHFLFPFSCVCSFLVGIGLLYIYEGSKFKLRII